MWKLTIEDDQGQRTVVNLARDDYSLGRAAECTIRLTERNISRLHAKLLRTGGCWFLQDQGSYNGVYVNGVRVGDSQELAHGDLIQLGDYRVELMDEALETREQGYRISSVPHAPRRDTLTGQPDRFVMLIGPTQGAEFALELERVVLGRGEECDICINHASVSRVHAEVRSVGEARYEIVDKGSANGVRVNGHELQRALLDARDVIELGDVVLKFIPRGQIFRADADESQRLPALRGVEIAKPAPPTRNNRYVIGAGVAVVATAVTVGVLLRLPQQDTAPAVARTSPAELQRTLLDEAVSLSRQGKLTQAHEQLKQLPVDSALRQTSEFMSVESAWADSLLEQATRQHDPLQKRSLLDQVAGAATVDAGRRQAAADALEALAASTVDLAELAPAEPSAHPPVGASADRPAALEPAQGEPQAAQGAKMGAPQSAPAAPETTPAPAPKRIVFEEEDLP